MIKAFRLLADFLEQERCNIKNVWNNFCESLKCKNKYSCKNCLCEKSIK